MAHYHEKNKRPVSITIFFLVFFLICTAGCVTQEHTIPPETVKVGLLLPITGDSSEFGKDCLNGTLLAIQEINDTGGILSLQGARLDPVIKDTKGIPSTGASETEQLIREESVTAIIGTYHSSVAIKSSEVAEKLKTPFIVNVGVADAVTERGFKYLFRVIPQAQNYGKNQVRFLSDLHNMTGVPVKRVAILHENTGFGTSVALGQREALMGSGYEPVIEVTYDAGNVTLMADEITRILSADPDVILETTYLKDSILIRKELARAGSVIPLIDTAGGTITTQYITVLGPLADGTLTLSEFSTRTPEGKELNDRYYTRFGTNITGDSAYSYQAVWVLKDALERAGSTDREMVRNALSKTDIPKGEHMILPDERIRFDAIGQNEFYQLFMLQIQHGELVPVWPEKYAVAPVLLQ